MSRPLAIRISLKDYDAFVQAIPDDEHLPASYDDFLQRGLEEDKQTIARGTVPNEIVIDYQSFAAYCRAAGQKMDYAMLVAYAVSKAMANP